MIYDISIPIKNNMVTYPGDPAVEISSFRRIAKGDSCNITILHMGSHTGTHLDAPYHFNQDGAKTDTLNLEACFGQCLVKEIPKEREAVLPEDLLDIDFAKFKRILFKTKNSSFWSDPEFKKDFCYISPEAAKIMLGKVLLVGIDYLSVEQFHAGHHKTHNTLLKNGIIALEGLNLSDAPPGVYTLSALPLKIENGDGSPTRAVLIS